MNVRFLDLRVTDVEERRLMMQAFERVLSHGQLIMGPELREFEKDVQSYCNCEYALGVASGTGALMSVLMGLGIGPGDEVITSAMSFAASANAIAMVGATPVLADVSDDFNISLASIERLISKRTKAIIPVHYAGLVCDIVGVLEIAKDKGLRVVEDASQAFGATLNGKFAGTFGDAGAISLNSMKLLASLGEAGLILTNDGSLAERIDALRYNGVKDRKDCLYPSFNNRLDTLHAAFLVERLKSLNAKIGRRRKLASIYRDRLKTVVGVPGELKDGEHSFFTYTIQSNDRDSLMAYLAKDGIETKVYHTTIGDEPAYRNTRGEFVNSRRLSRRKLAIPCHEKLTNDEANYVADRICAFYAR